MIHHPVHDLGPDLLQFTLGQMQAMLSDLRQRGDLSEKQKARTSMFMVLVARYEQIVWPLSVWCHHRNAAELRRWQDFSELFPETAIKNILLADPDEETTEVLLKELSAVITSLLQMKPVNDAQVKAKATGLGSMLAFYQIAHQIYFYFIEMPDVKISEIIHDTGRN